MRRQTVPVLAAALLLVACGSTTSSPSDSDAIITPPATAAETASMAPSQEPSDEATPSSGAGGEVELASFSDALGALTVDAPVGWAIDNDATESGAFLALSDNIQYEFGDTGELILFAASDLAPTEGNDAQRLTTLVETLAEISQRDDIDAICGQRGSFSLGTEDDHPIGRGTSHFADWGVADMWTECGSADVGTIIELIGAPDGFGYGVYVLLVLPTPDDVELIEPILGSIDIDPGLLP